jgi:hypothetical protein
VRDEGGILVCTGPDADRRLGYLQVVQRDANLVFAFSDPGRSRYQVVPLSQITDWARSEAAWVHDAYLPPGPLAGGTPAALPGGQPSRVPGLAVGGGLPVAGVVVPALAGVVVPALPGLAGPDGGAGLGEFDARVFDVAWGKMPVKAVEEKIAQARQMIDRGDLVMDVMTESTSIIGLGPLEQAVLYLAYQLYSDPGNDAGNWALAGALAARLDEVLPPPGLLDGGTAGT